MNYLAYTFVVSPPQPGSEILMAVLGEMGFETFEVSGDGFTGYINENEATGLEVGDLKFDDFTFSFRTDVIETVNWNAEWEKNFEPVKVRDLLLIRAPFHSPDASSKLEIVIMPKMSFGTGHHQTTRLVCEMMFEIDFKGKQVLDMGCGTGVLAILAAKLGAAGVTGIDIDEWSVANAKENCKANSSEDIRVIKGGVEKVDGGPSFDVILANINRNILMQQMPSYAAHLNPGGTLVLSGFFVTDVKELKKECERLGLSHSRTRSEDEWAMVEMTKVNP